MSRFEILGTDAAGLNPGDSGYDATTDPTSPNYVDPNVVTDPNIPPPDASSDPPPIPAVPLDTTIQTVPSDGVLYDGSKGMPNYCVGSKGFFDSMTPAPSGQSAEDWANAKGFVWGFNYISWPNSANPTRWFFISGSHGGIGAGVNWDNLRAEDLPVPAAASARGGYGPIIGNPKMDDFKNLRYAVKDQKYFWYPSEAPDWATAETRRLIAVTNQQTAKTLADAAAAQKVLDDAKAKALQDALDAQNVADQQAQHAQDQAQQAADAAAKVQQTQQGSQQSQIDMEQAAAQAKIDMEQQEADIAAQKAAAEYAASHPDQAPPDAGGGGGPTDDGSSDGAYYGAANDEMESATADSDTTDRSAEEPA